MNVNQKIEAALAGFVDGNIWALSCPLETLPGEFIVYYPSCDSPEDFGDDSDLTWVHHMEVNWFKRGTSLNRTSAVVSDYTEARDTIRSALKGAGFTISRIVPMYEKDTGYTSLTFVCSIMED